MRGDVDVTAEELAIGPEARIEGNVVHRGPREPRIDAGARIEGRVEHRPAQAPAARRFGALALVLGIAALFATGAVMILLFPRFSAAAAGTIATGTATRARSCCGFTAWLARRDRRRRRRRTGAHGATGASATTSWISSGGAGFPRCRLNPAASARR